MLATLLARILGHRPVSSLEAYYTGLLRRSPELAPTMDEARRDFIAAIAFTRRAA